MLRVDVRDGVVSEVPPSQICSSPQFVYKKELARKGARLKYLVAEKSALMRYLVHNLKIMNLIRELFAMRTIKYEDNVEVGVFNSHMGSIRLATEYILGQIRNENKDKRIIFIMDAPRRNIYKNTLDKSKTFKLHELMRTLCANNGFELIDLTEPMREDFEKNRREFQSEHDWHWNEEGHRVAYEQVLRLLRVKGP